MNSNSKGKRGERAILQKLAQHLGIKTRRTAQVDGSLSADLVGWDGVHLECKWYKAFAAMRHLEQAERDAAGSGNVPVAVLRENGNTDPAILVRVSDFPALCERYAAISGRPTYPSKGEA